MTTKSVFSGRMLDCIAATLSCGGSCHSEMVGLDLGSSGSLVTASRIVVRSSGSLPMLEFQYKSIRNWI